MNKQQKKLSDVARDFEKSKSRMWLWTLLTSMVVVALVGFSLYAANVRAHETDASLILQQEELQTDYRATLSDLENAKSAQEDLNSIVTSQKSELEAQSRQISSMLSANQDLNVYVQKVDRLEASNKEKDKQLQTSQRTISELKSDRGELERSLAKTNNELSRSKQTVKQLSEERKLLMTKVNDLQKLKGEYQKMEMRIADLETENTQLRKKIEASNTSGNKYQKLKDDRDYYRGKYKDVSDQLAEIKKKYDLD